MALYRYRYGVEAEQQPNGSWRCVWPDGVAFKMSNVQFHEVFEAWDGPQPEFVDLKLEDADGILDTHNRRV
jgi:hypothetical protein